MIHRFLIRHPDLISVNVELEGPTLPLNGTVRLESTADGWELVLYLDDTGLAPEVVDSIRVQMEEA